MTFTVIYDACVLYPASLRDLLMRIAMTGIVSARWTDEILDECFRNVLADRPELNEAALTRTRKLMNLAVPDCLVTNYEALGPNLELPDPDDRHVLAAAIRAGAQSIITSNLKDFPREQLARYGVEAVHPDDFILSMIDLSEGAVCSAITKQQMRLRNPPMSMTELLDGLQQVGLVGSVARLRSLVPV